MAADATEACFLIGQSAFDRAGFVPEAAGVRFLSRLQDSDILDHTYEDLMFRYVSWKEQDEDLDPDIISGVEDRNGPGSDVPQLQKWGLSESAARALRATVSHPETWREHLLVSRAHWWIWNYKDVLYGHGSHEDIADIHALRSSKDFMMGSIN